MADILLRIAEYDTAAAAFECAENATNENEKERQKIEDEYDDTPELRVRLHMAIQIENDGLIEWCKLLDRWNDIREALNAEAQEALAKRDYERYLVRHYEKVARYLAQEKIRVLEEVAHDGNALQGASFTLKMDKDVVLAAVRQNVNAFQYVNHEVWRNISFCVELGELGIAIPDAYRVKIESIQNLKNWGRTSKTPLEEMLPEGPVQDILSFLGRVRKK
jgi:hypothetical protein